MSEQIILEVKFNDKLQSIFLDDYRIGGCKWNDIDNGKTIKLYIKKQDLLHALKLEAEQVKKRAVEEFVVKAVDTLDEMGMERSSEYNDGYDDGVADCITNIKSLLQEFCKNA